MKLCGTIGTQNSFLKGKKCNIMYIYIKYQIMRICGIGNLLVYLKLIFVYHKFIFVDLNFFFVDLKFISVYLKFIFVYLKFIFVYLKFIFVYRLLTYLK